MSVGHPLSLILAILLITVSHASFSAPDNFDELLEWAQKQKQQSHQIDQSRLAQFREAHDQQKELLDKANRELDEQKELSRQLLKQFDDNEALISELENRLEERSGELNELSGLTRQTAGDLQALLSQSLTTSQYPEQLQLINSVNMDSKVVSIPMLETIWLGMLHELKATGEITRFKTKIVDTEGTFKETTIVRAGPFNAYSDDRFLNFNSGTKRLEVLVRQPASGDQKIINIYGTTSEPISTAVIDPTRGMLLGMLMDTPTPVERIQQGGWIGYIILSLGALGILIIIYRLTSLFIIDHRVAQQLKDVHQANTNNPLGRILKVKDDNPGHDLEELQMHIDEAILKELPSLEQGTGLIKLLAGIAPLLGLLGTVTGMIMTFQSISLFGTGDPKLMASGISQALVTTMLGLIAAVPLLFGHALVSTRSRRIIQILDQQSAGLMADFENE